MVTMTVVAVGFFLSPVSCPMSRSYAAVEMPYESTLDGLEWLGHAAFRLKKAGVSLYYDPWKIDGEPKDADVVFVSHPHFDHFDLEDLAKVAKAETVIVTVEEVAAKLAETEIPGTVKIVKPGDQLEVGALKIEVVPAYNINKEFHLKESQWAGFIVELEGIRFYHAGDTDKIPEMQSIAADVALLPVSGTYVMTAEDAAEAAKLFKPDVAVPMHYGSIIGTAADAKRFESLSGGLVAEILEKSGGRSKVEGGR